MALEEMVEEDGGMPAEIGEVGEGEDRMGEAGDEIRCERHLRVI